MSSGLDTALDKYGEKTLLYEAHDKWIKAEAKAEIKSLMLDIIGEDESEIIHQRLSDEYAEVRNDLRAKLRNKLEEL